MCRLRRGLAGRVRFRRRRWCGVFRGFRGAWGGRRLQGGPGRRFLRKQVRLRSHQLLHALPTPSLLHAPASSTGRLVGAARDEHDCQRQAHGGCPLFYLLSAEACTLPKRDAGVEKCRSQLLSVISHGVGAIVSFYTMLAADGGLDLSGGGLCASYPCGRCPEGCSSAAIGDFR